MRHVNHHIYHTFYRFVYISCIFFIKGANNSGVASKWSGGRREVGFSYKGPSPSRVLSPSAWPIWTSELPWHSMMYCPGEERLAAFLLTDRWHTHSYRPNCLWWLISSLLAPEDWASRPGFIRPAGEGLSRGNGPGRRCAGFVCFITSCNQLARFAFVAHSRRPELEQDWISPPVLCRPFHQIADYRLPPRELQLQSKPIWQNESRFGEILFLYHAFIYDDVQWVSEIAPWGAQQNSLILDFFHLNDVFRISQKSVLDR